VYLPAEPQCVTELHIRYRLVKATSHWQNKRRPDCQRAISYQPARRKHLSILFRILYHDFSMAKDIVEQVEPHIREILRICHALNVEGKELQELNALVGRTSKLIFIQSLPVR
jgi:hypothetical protein